MLVSAPLCVCLLCSICCMIEFGTVHAIWYGLSTLSAKNVQMSNYCCQKRACAIETTEIEIDRMFRSTAFDRLLAENKAFSIITLCKDFDVEIDKGIPCGVITEIAGAPGCGKTQIW